MKYEFETEIPCPYKTHKDLSDRLHGTICRYKGGPVYVSFSGEENQIILYSTDKKKKLEIIPMSHADKIDVSSMEVGYVNYENTSGLNKVYYVKRVTDRQYKQGLCNYNVTYDNLSGERTGIDLLHQKCFEDMLKGIYPTFEEALSRIGRDGEMAISQEVALKKLPVGVILLYLRGKNLGWIAPNSKNINLENSNTKWVAQKHLQAYGFQVQ